MEFTYDGLVRYGFGFYNPNHAAALICAILPFVWILFLSENFYKKLFGGILSTVLLVALVFTYSRSGILVATLEAIFFILFYGRKYWKIFVGLGVGLLIVLFVSGGFGRLTFDTSASNRLLIWANGLYLFLANPLGVGLGNSGEITSAFLLPYDINCRTLINSHLTLLCEFGCIIGAVWFAIIFTAIKNGISSKTSKLKFATLNSFCGLLISSSLSTVFDWEVLLNPSQFTHLTEVNLACAYLLFGVFCLLTAYLLIGDFRIKTFSTSFFVFLALGFIIFVVSGKIPLKVRTYDNATFVQTCKDPPFSVVIFDDNYTLKSALQTLRKLKLDDNILIATKSWQYKEKLPRQNPKSWILFGKCADFASSNPASPIILIKPSPYYKINKGSPISQIYLPKWDPKYNRLKKEFQNWKGLRFFNKL